MHSMCISVLRLQNENLCHSLPFFLDHKMTGRRCSSRFEAGALGVGITIRRARGFTPPSGSLCSLTIRQILHGHFSVSAVYSSATLPPKGLRTRKSKRRSYGTLLGRTGWGQRKRWGRIGTKCCDCPHLVGPDVGVCKSEVAPMIRTRERISGAVSL